MIVRTSSKTAGVRPWVLGLSLLGLLGLHGATTAQAQYQYGQYGGFDDAGFSVEFEALMANPRNTDAVVAVTENTQGTTSILPNWDDEATGRLALGYKWASGNKLTLSVWSFEADQRAAGSAASGATHFTIGPAFLDGRGGYLGNRGVPGTFDITTEIEAQTLDLALSRQFEAGDGLNLEFSIGMRVASFEETMAGTYGGDPRFDPGAGPILASKKNDADMFGLRGAVRGTYRLSGSFSLRGSLALSMLDGEVTASSGLTAGGTVGGNTVGPSSSRVDDDGRSGTIRDIEAAVVWTSTNGGVSVWLGWEQSEWEEIAADLMRNFPGSTALLRERDSATFSGYKLGVSYSF